MTTHIVPAVMNANRPLSVVLMVCTLDVLAERRSIHQPSLRLVEREMVCASMETWWTLCHYMAGQCENTKDEL